MHDAWDAAPSGAVTDTSRLLPPQRCHMSIEGTYEFSVRVFMQKNLIGIFDVIPRDMYIPGETICSGAEKDGEIFHFVFR
jgi:hypothetical protein